MKTMTQEEKARAYDEAVLNGSRLWESGEITRENYEYIFPELKESDDERIRKELICFLETEIPQCNARDKYITWLEKQGEQNPTDKVEPKFKVGDKIQFSKGCGTIMTIEKIENDEYIFANNMGHTTIEDGNKWYLVECNPTWSEEDEAILDGVLTFIPDKEQKDWLKSLKDRVLPQPKQEWNEEDEDILNTIINHFEIDLECTENDDIIRWLKSLRPQNKWKPSEGQLECLGYAIEKAEIDWSPLTNNRIYLTLKALKEQLGKL